jgi:hypothetical protein
VLAVELAGALLIGLLTLVGTASLTGSAGPWIVLAFAAGAALALRAWVTGRLAGTELTGDDRTLHLLVTVLLGLSVAFAAIAAVVITAFG